MNVQIEYQEALDYLYSFIDYSLTRSFRYTPDKFNLDRMYELMRKLGDPQLQYPVIHVAGTKGKGSVSALCASAIRMTGQKVGFYTSPHLLEYTERIQVNGEQIPREIFIELINEIKPHASSIEHITTFELTTAIGFLYFARQKVDVAVIEVGLGGRLDATNIVKPLVSVITSLSYDHMNVLGDTLSKIAFEKAGIIKPLRPVVSSPQQDEARLVLESVAQERQAPLIEVGRDYLYKPLVHNLDQQSFEIRRYDGEPETNQVFSIPLLGLHQVENAATAYTALSVARQEGLQISEEAIQSGFAAVSWPGRFEILRENPPIVVDSAHNSNSALRLRQAIDDYFPGKDVILVFGASEDKDIAGMYSELLPSTRLLITTQSVHPRAMDAHKLAELAMAYNCRIQVAIPVEKAINNALAEAGTESLILVAGSIFIAAAGREIWLSRQKTVIPVDGSLLKTGRKFR
jgi:dihydrofolate synthase/folylpolyglutamate synthase